MSEEPEIPEDPEDKEFEAEEEPFTPARLRREIQQWDDIYISRYITNLKSIKDNIKRQLSSVNEILDVVYAETKRRKAINKPWL